MSAREMALNVRFRHNFSMERKPEGMFPPNRVAEWRLRRGLSMGGLAKKMPFQATASQINKIEKRHQNLDVKWIMGLAEALELNNPGDLLVLPDGKTPSEKAMKIAHAFDGLSEADQQVAFRMVDSLAQQSSAVPAETAAPVTGDVSKHEDRKKAV